MYKMSIIGGLLTVLLVFVTTGYAQDTETLASLEHSQAPVLLQLSEAHYLRDIEYYLLRPNCADTGSAFRVNYGLQENAAEPEYEKAEMPSVGYGCLGAYQGCVFGFFLGAFATAALSEKPKDWEEWGAGMDRILTVGIGSSIAGAVMGAMMGSRANTRTQKTCLTAGAILATVPVLLFLADM